MLVLTRKVGDVIAIGDNIKIVVMAIKGKQVRLGVQADRNTVVHREEIYQKIQQETKAAMQSDMGDTKAAGELLKKAHTNDEALQNQIANAASQGKRVEPSQLSSGGARGTGVFKRVEIRRAAVQTSESDVNDDTDEDTPTAK